MYSPSHKYHQRLLGTLEPPVTTATYDNERKRKSTLKGKRIERELIEGTDGWHSVAMIVLTVNLRNRQSVKHKRQALAVLKKRIPQLIRSLNGVLQTQSYAWTLEFQEHTHNPHVHILVEPGLGGVEVVEQSVIHFLGKLRNKLCCTSLIEVKEWEPEGVCHYVTETWRSDDLPDWFRTNESNRYGHSRCFISKKPCFSRTDNPTPDNQLSKADRRVRMLSDYAKVQRAELKRAKQHESPIQRPENSTHRVLKFRHRKHSETGKPIGLVRVSLDVWIDEAFLIWITNQLSTVLIDRQFPTYDLFDDRLFEIPRLKEQHGDVPPMIRRLIESKLQKLNNPAPIGAHHETNSANLIELEESELPF